MPTLSLDDIAARINEKYAPTTIQLPDGRSVILTVPFRLSKEKRAEIRAISKANTDAAAQAEHAQKMRDQNNEQRVKDGLEPINLTDEDQDQLNEQAEQRTRTYLQGIIRVAASDRSAADELLRLVAAGGDELLALSEIVSAYMGTAQVGEALPSPS